VAPRVTLSVLHLAAAHSHHAFRASLGDVIAVAALALAWLIFRLDRRGSDAGEVRAATTLLRGVRDQFFYVFGPAYFAGIWTPEASEQRAREQVGKMDHVNLLPVEPIAALVADQRGVEAGLISADTMNHGTLALWHVNRINEFIRRQSVFNAIHAPDFFDSSLLRRSRRKAVIEGSVQISIQLHRDVIRDARDDWYRPFEQCVDQD
jgi:hypothetical protein